MSKNTNVVLSREQALLLLKNLSAIEGYLFSVRAEGQRDIMETYATPAVDLLFGKLK